ncbi:alpha/beta hydrolase [Sporolactobacillus sp. STSJ-5]|uniref:alpha/beta family hydrolase n=1 Tax=Sporolactobacillus sp. STSJ-5 TaxID=2965076 RepID=UPI00210564E3|nr:alpha/beta family hydrolase [Sporolactobacillus sp. STSJ-5]MCQ2009804.1 alpha/beta hydrolase [Sporolactobacillus sp. STSJ-5]
MKVIEKSVKAVDHMIAYTHIAVGAKTVCFMFSGIGYNYDKPLLYYATMEMLQNTIDVVHVHYMYDKKMLKKPFDVKSKMMMRDIQPVIDDVLVGHTYEHCMFLGKSIGTIPITADLIKKEAFRNSKIILLTPLITYDNLFTNLLESKHQGLFVIGDRDRFFDSERVEQLRRTNLHIEVIHDADHSLDVGVDTFDTASSIAALARVMELIHGTIKNEQG